jgi:hypothetical protein
VGLSEDVEDDGARGVSRAEIAINSVLGTERRARILASLYVIRADTSAVVRQCALQVRSWGLTLCRRSHDCVLDT